MPDDKIEFLDDIITDMDIETITLDDVELNETEPKEKSASEQAGKSASDDISSSIEEISFEPFQTPRSPESEDIPIPNLDSIQSIPEPEMPSSTPFSIEETAVQETFPGPENPAGQSFTTEDDIISIEGNELDRLIYSGFKAENVQGAKAPAVGEMHLLNDIPIIEESKIEEEIPVIVEEPAREETFIPPIDLNIEELPARKEEPVLSDFNFDLSAIPDVSEVEEDEPIALSLDELNKIDISEELVADYEPAETPKAPDVPEIEEIPLMEEENVEISLDEINGIGQSLPEADKISHSAYIFEAPENKEGKEQVIEEKIDVLSDSSKEDLRKVLGYLDNLLENLPEDKIKEFAKSDYYDLYVKILSKLGI